MKDGEPKDKNSNKEQQNGNKQFSKGVKKACQTDQGHQVRRENSLFGSQGVPIGRRLKALNTMLEYTKGIKKCIGDITSIKVRKQKFVLEPMVVAKHGMEEHWGHWKGLIIF